MHRIVVIAVAPVPAFDLSIPELIFSQVEVDGQRAYDVRVCAAEPGLLDSGGPSTCASVKDWTRSLTPTRSW